MSVISTVNFSSSKYLSDILPVVGNVILASKPAEVNVCHEEPEIDLKPEPTDDCLLTVDENSKFSTDLPDTMQSSEQDGCILEADGTESASSSAVNSVVQLSQRKRVRQRKSGSSLLTSG